MIALCLLWLASASIGAQSAAPLTLDVRVFRGVTDVTGDTLVTLFPVGARTGGRPVPLVPSGERRLALPSGQYDLQLVQQRAGEVVGISWTSLRLLVDYPGEYQQHLEVVNLEKGWGALQVRRAGTREQAPVAWSARLTRRDGSEAARGVVGHGYVVLVAPAGTYDVEVTRADGSTTAIRGVEVRENLTYLKTF
ncbi:MAG: hypothetical protein ACR2LU_05235 [Luteitalea sp.]